MKKEKLNEMEPKYNLHNRHEIPKDYKCCYTCHYMKWMVGIGQGVRCSKPDNNYRVFREKWGKEDIFDTNARIDDTTKLKLPVIPGIGRSCEHYTNKTQRAKNRAKYIELYAHDQQISLIEAEREVGE